jgi:hypothetical protein
MKAAKMLVPACCLILCGCSIVEFFTPEGPPSDQQTSVCYYKTKLKVSSSADVLAVINLPEYELVSRSKSVIASAGQKKKGYKSWFTLIAFDENESTAKRKYLFVVDEKPKILFVEPREGLRFDCEVALGSDVLGKPYAEENARRIAILKDVLKSFRKDTGEVSPDNKELGIDGMLVNQALEAVLVKLEDSPALAARLNEPNGVDFSHINFDRGKIRMIITDDIAAVRIRLGSFAKDLKDIQQETADSRHEAPERKIIIHPLLH